ncbi:hypothetical protein, partial [Klebsiella pneumoniae]|uniref:hypothetical protein n=1 Tax=Klebsiella pneumoniae TaxID=573 RepID=UPI002731AE1E
NAAIGQSSGLNLREAPVGILVGNAACETVALSHAAAGVHSGIPASEGWLLEAVKRRGLTK